LKLAARWASYMILVKFKFISTFPMLADLISGRSNLKISAAVML